MASCDARSRYMLLSTKIPSRHRFIFFLYFYGVFFFSILLCNRICGLFGTIIILSPEDLERHNAKHLGSASLQDTHKQMGPAWSAVMGGDDAAHEYSLPILNTISCHTMGCVTWDLSGESNSYHPRPKAEGDKSCRG